MHKSSLLRMQWFVHNYLSDSREKIKILDVGSYSVNGSYKDFFDAQRFDYTGLDMVPGPNVDIAPQFPYMWKEVEGESFDVVISGQAFEHIEFPWVTMTEIARVMKKDGLLCIIVPRLQERHRCPVDTYRYDADGIVALARHAGLIPLHASTNLGPKDCPKEWYSSEGDTMLVARKPQGWAGVIDMASYVFSPNNADELTSGFIEAKDQDYGKSFAAYMERRIITFAHSVRKRLE